uniref:Triosephosphate isomerase n=1 Tax=Euglena gracilis TaxID=3039 RepID=Q6VEG5_EUGGR|nr:chloroplast trisophosphate isomerase [Euglena gracilis]
MDYYTVAHIDEPCSQPWYKSRVAAFFGGCLLATCMSLRFKGTVQENYAVGTKPAVHSLPLAALGTWGRSQVPQNPPQNGFNNFGRRSSALQMTVGGWAPSAKMPRKFIVGGNWKCNGDRASIKALIQALNAGESTIGSGVDVVVAPPMLYGDYARGLLRSDFGVAFQNCWVGGNGAFTGEVSADMIKDAGFDWVILGHSERRSLPEIKETDETVATKTAYALEAGLKVMLCIGETLDARQSGKTDEVNARQLAAVAEKVSDWSNIVIAYEPAWAIGTGVVATPEQAQETHTQIRKWLAENISPQVAQQMRIMYGGSANAANADSLARQPDIDGFLVGGASLRPEFLRIVESWKRKVE